jgi:hypothetical protein
MSLTATDTVELTAPAPAVTTTRKLSFTGDEPIEREVARPASEQPSLKKGTTAIIFASITGVTGISSLLAGLVTVVLPTVAKDLSLSDAVLLWYIQPFAHRS